MDKNKFIGKQRQRRRFRIRKKVRGDQQRPRLCVFRSNKHIACQLIDDESRKTIVSASTRDKDLSGSISFGGNKAAAEVIGKAVADRALAAGVTAVRLDRGNCKYHGRVAALADAARKAGLTL